MEVRPSTSKLGGLRIATVEDARVKPPYRNMPAGFQGLAFGVYVFWLLFSFGVVPLTLVWVVNTTAASDPGFTRWIASGTHKLVLAAALAPVILICVGAGAFAIVQIRKLLAGRWPFPWSSD